MGAATWVASIAAGRVCGFSVQRQHMRPVREADHCRGHSGHLHRMTSSPSVLPFPPHGRQMEVLVERQWKPTGGSVEAEWRTFTFLWIAGMHIAFAGRISDA